MKYMGNKQRIADEIIPIMLDNSLSNTFVDLFCGSCSIIQRIPDLFHRIANDKNRYLIKMWKALINGVEYPKTITKEEYSLHRDIYNEEKKGKRTLTDEEYAEVGWYGWMGSFNGRWFDGGYSGHNVMQKNGKSRDYITEQINNTLAQVPYLQGVQFYSKDYADIDIPDNSIVYCDIPYRNTKQYATSKDFDYDKFYDWCRQNKNKYNIFISEYSMPDDFECIWSKEVTNAMNTTITKKPIEKLFII